MDEEFFPAMRGPGKKYFVLDRHHAALALSHEKAECVQVGSVRDLSALSPRDFWVFLDHYSWMHCYDARGKRRALDEIPKRFEEMEDDPYRSLRRPRDQGGYSKVDVLLEFCGPTTSGKRRPAFAKGRPEGGVVKGTENCRLQEEQQFPPGWCGSHKGRNLVARQPHARGAG
jgi:hypothetical protein